MSQQNFPPPLNANSKYGASATIRAFRYQILRSLLAWLSLRSDDYVLYLECAEDFDIVAGSEAQATQIKDIKKPVTLRSIEVSAFLNRWWNLRNQNLERSITGMFVTTGRFTSERGTKLNRPGLDAWGMMTCEDDIEGLRSMILQNTNLCSDLATFLKQSSPQELFRDLLSRIKWVSEAEKSPVIVDTIRKLLVQFGANLHFNSEVSEQVLQDLYWVVSERVTAKEPNERILTLKELTKSFAESANRKLPQGDFKKLKGRVDNLESQFYESFKCSTNSDPRLTQEELLQPPPLKPDWALPRNSIVSGIEPLLCFNTVLILKGSVGNGKSTLAKILLSRSTRDNWRWVSMRIGESARISERLGLVSKMVLDASQVDGIVIDDLDFHRACEEMGPSDLASTFETLLSCGVRLLITSSTAMPASVQSLLLSPVRTEEVPLLNVEELREWIACMGCPGMDLDSWLILLLGETGGHPQLAHARLRMLVNQGWPAPSMGDPLLRSSEVLDLRRETVRNATRLNDTEREMLYRLSLLKGAFKRRVAIEIACDPPSLQFPGDAFDALIGPWVVLEGDDNYRVSPIVHDLAREVWSHDRLVSLTGRISEILLDSDTISSSDISWCILYSIEGHNKISFIRCLISVLTCKEEARESVDAALSWLSLLDMKTVSSKLEIGPSERCLLHQTRFRIAVVHAPSTVAKLIAGWQADLDLISPEPLKLLSSVLFYYKILIQKDAEVSPETLFWMLTQLLDLIAEGEVLPELEHATTGLMNIGGGEPGGLPSFLMPAILIRSRGLRGLNSFLAGLKSLESEIRAQCLLIFSGTQPLARAFVDGVWIDEYRADNPDWVTCEALLSEVVELARNESIPELAFAAARALGIVVGELQKDANRALTIIETVEKEFGQSYLLHDGKAAILKAQGQNRAAIEEIKSMLLDLEGSEIADDSACLLSCRQAGIIAMQEEEWEIASELFSKAIEYANHLNECTQRSGLLVDSSYSLWRLGERSRSLGLLANGLRALTDCEDDPGFHARTRLVGKVVEVIRAESQGKVSDDLTLVVPGMCSNPEPDQRLFTLPRVPIEICWAGLAEVAVNIGEHLDIVDEANQKVMHSSLPSARFAMASTMMNKKLMVGEVSELPEFRRLLIQSLSWFDDANSAGFGPFEPYEHNFSEQPSTKFEHALMIEIITAGLVVVSAQGGDLSEMIRTWINQTESQNNTHSYFKEALSALTLAEHQAIQMVLNMSIDREKRVFAAMRCLLSTPNRPEALFVSHIVIFNTLQQSGLLRAVSRWFADLLAKHWIKKSAFRANLLSPQISVPAILKACEDKEVSSNTRCARILLAAHKAVRVHIPDETLRCLKEMAAIAKPKQLVEEAED